MKWYVENAFGLTGYGHVTREPIPTRYVPIYGNTHRPLTVDAKTEAEAIQKANDALKGRGVTIRHKQPYEA